MSPLVLLVRPVHQARPDRKAPRVLSATLVLRTNKAHRPARRGSVTSLLTWQVGVALEAQLPDHSVACRTRLQDGFRLDRSSRPWDRVHGTLMPILLDPVGLRAALELPALPALQDKAASRQTRHQQADKIPTEPKTSGQASKQPAQGSAPPPPVESKPTAEEVKATAASLANNGPTAGEPAKTIPTGPKSNRPTQILPAVPLPAALTAKATQQSQAAPKSVSEQSTAAAAAAALRDATQAAKEAVAVAMAKLDTSATIPHSESAVDNLTKKVNEMRMEAARTGQGNRGGRGRGPRPAKVEVPDTDFDFASANAKFNKQDVVKEAIAGSPLNEVPNGEAAKLEAATDIPASVEPAYNKSKSFFDNISSEMKDRENAGQKPGGREWRGEEQRKNIETFGQGSVDGGYRGYRGGRGRGRGGRGRGYRGGRGGNGGFRHQREAQPAAQ
ncbi:Protein LSM14 B-B [Madurella mycetomatis]|uniref:Protein LSM14 B-B n=1 Tax=Madurella mycetomatis TaxID=100816 RepID=A0A175WFB3_9PEZI|nr:Protein LSM14 B-B [Madurella mycetomatis]